MEVTHHFVSPITRCSMGLPSFVEKVERGSCDGLEVELGRGFFGSYAPADTLFSAAGSATPDRPRSPLRSMNSMVPNRSSFDRRRDVPRPVAHL